MAIKLSTGLRGKLMDTGSLKTIMAGGLIRIYVRRRNAARASEE